MMKSTKIRAVKKDGRNIIKKMKNISVNKNKKTSWQKYVEKILLINKFTWNEQKSIDGEIWNIISNIQWYSFD